MPWGNSVLLGQSGWPFHLNKDKDFDLPTFSTKDIYVLENLLNEGYIARVMVEGKEMLVGGKMPHRGSWTVSGRLLHLK